MRLINTLCCALVITAGSTAALGQEAAPPAIAPAPADPAPSDPAAKEFYTAFKAAAAKIADVSYRVVLKSAGDGEDESGTARLRFTLDRADPGAPLKLYHFQLLDTEGKVAEEWASNGTQVQKLDFDAKKLLAAKIPDDATLLPPDSMISFIAPWVFEIEDEGMPELLHLVSARFLPDESAGGVNCRVLETREEVEFPAMPMGEDGEEPEGDAKKEKSDNTAPDRTIVILSTRWINAQDMGLRKLRTLYKFPKMTGMRLEDSSIEAEFFDFTLNQKPGSEQFVIKTPEGFTAEETDLDTLGMSPEPEDEAAPELKFAAGDAAPAFSLKDTTGNAVTLESLKGRVVLLDFWATWCGPCKMAMPSIQKLHDRFKDKPVSIIGINTWEDDADAAVAYMTKKKFTYPCLLKGDELAEAYGLSGIPTLVLIGKDGKVIEISVGFDPATEESLAAKIEAELDRK
ncbi:MAG: TlpA family protein disulfide reductase [Phycisphaerales bacterium]